VEGLDPQVQAAHAAGLWVDMRAAKKKAPANRPGLESLIAVITVRLLLREEKQGTTALRLSSAVDFSR
jgi:hypothetical protein